MILHSVLRQLQDQRQTGVFRGLNEGLGVVKKDHIESGKANLARGALACEYSGISKHRDLLSCEFKTNGWG